MTGAEFIKWIEDNHAEELPIEIQYQDDGGCYYGTEKEYIVPKIVEPNEKTQFSGCESYRRIVV